MKRTADPITLQVIKNALYSITDEMSMALIRASYSTNIKDRRDCSTAMYTPKGELIAQTEIGTPIHLGAMPSVVHNVLKVFPVDAMKHGDHILTNLPFPEGPGHLNDITCVSPVFSNGQVVALIGNMAHHVDVGGGAPGSMPAGVTEIFQEGLQIPPVKIVNKGIVNEELIRFINQNVRTSFESRGDLMAQVAANNVGSRRLREVVERYDVETIAFYMDALMDYSERRMRAGIRKVPNGTYSFEDYIEGTPNTKDLIKVAVKVEVRDDSIVVDYSGSDDQQRDSVNSSVVAARASAYYVFRCLIDPDVPPNSGAYRPIEVRARAGSVVSAKFPLPVCNSTIITAPKAVDALLGALLNVFKKNTQAASCGVTSLLNIGGTMNGSETLYNYVETYAGGQGGMDELDGMDAVQTHMTNTRNAPVEVIEATYPLRVLRYGLVPDSEGAGRKRGGVGMCREILIESDDTTITVSTDRNKLKPWGAFGGKDACGSQCHIRHLDGKEEELPYTKYTAPIARGDSFTIITPGGGGWGNPFEREPEKVRWDVLEGLVSIERAKEFYGVVIDPVTSEIDKAKTKTLRAVV